MNNTKIKEFINFIEQNQVNPSENLADIVRCLKSNQKISFFSWKMFSIRKNGPQISSDPSFNTAEADQFIDKEIKFLDLLLKLRVKFEYIKIIPDEIPGVFFNQPQSETANRFANQVSGYFQKVYPSTQIFRISKLLEQPTFLSLYQTVFSSSQKANINPCEFRKEKIFRSTYYTASPLSEQESQALASKAFGLFAAETALILRCIKNPILLAGQRSINTYKYEFYRCPKNRPILPKLFVL